jgi:hypothetical protein
VDAQAMAGVTTAIVALTQLTKWFGMPTKYAPVLVMSLSFIGCMFWGWTHANISRETAWDYFVGWIMVSTSAAGVWGFTRSTAEALTSGKKADGI